MLFRNLSLFRFSPAVAADLSHLPDALAEHRLHPCGPLEMCSRGFVPTDAEGPMTRTLKHYTLLAIGSEDKLLPAQVINEELQRKVRAIAEEHGRRVGGRERKRIKDEVITDLLPRAFVRSSRMSVYVDREHGWVVLDTASRKSAEQALTQIREALGSFPAVPLAPASSPRLSMTEWLSSGQLPANLQLGDECELRDPATANGGRWKGRRTDLDAEEVKEHLRSGKQVFQLGLVFNDRISFVLGEDLVVRKLKFLDVVTQELNDSPADAQAEAEAIFALLTLELARLLATLETCFAIPRPQDV